MILRIFNYANNNFVIYIRTAIVGISAIKILLNELAIDTSI